MQIKSLEIARRPSYDSDFPNQLVGTVELCGPNGAMKIVLSPGALSRVFGVIAAEVQETARANAVAARRGMEDAMNEPLALTAQIIPVGD